MADKTADSNPDRPAVPVSRRNLFGGIALAMVLPKPMSAAQVAHRLSDLDVLSLHNLLRGLVLLEKLGDPLIDEDTAGLIEQIATRLPEAPLMVALYRDFLARNTLGRWREEDGGDLSILHHAIAEGHPVAFRYTDLKDEETQRRVLPLALQHPAHGIQLLGWCELRGDYRRFFVGSMQGLAAQPGNFSARRMDLLRGLLESEGIEI